MDITATANALLPLLGGKENIASATHCATRLRLVLVDDSKVDKEAIGKLDGVKGCFSNAGQIQVIFGTGLVNKVHAEFIKAAGVSEPSKAEAADIAAKKLNPLQRIARLLSNIFVPIIPAIVASGLLMGLLGMVKTYGWADADSALFVMLNMFSSAAFIILPILIGFTAAREFGGNPYLGATLGGILTHPALTNAWGVAGGFHTMNFFGLEIAMIGYQGTVFPVLLTVWFMSLLEKRLRKVIPNALDLILTPFLTVVISGFVALLFIGPAGRALGDGISFVLSTLIAHAGWFAGLLFGGLYSAIVITGIHHSFHAVEAGLLGNPNIGVNFLLPIWSMANIAQGGACLAVYFKTRDAKIKAIAVPSAFSAMLGITEAALVMQAIAQSGAGFSGASAIHLNIFGPHPIVKHGTDAQRERMLVPLIKGETKACFGVTEPDAGLDTTKLKTFARKVPGGYSIIAVQDVRRILTADPRNAVLSLKQVTVSFPAGTTRAQAEPIVGSIQLTRTNRGLLVDGRLRTSLLERCGRCLAPVTAGVEVDLREEALPTVDVESGQATDLSGEDSGLRIDAQHVLDLEPAVREAISLAEPMNVLCREACLGLCPECGRDLNLEPHRHEREPDPRLAPLARLLDRERD